MFKIAGLELQILAGLALATEFCPVVEDIAKTGPE